MRICSLLPGATEIVAELGLVEARRHFGPRTRRGHVRSAPGFCAEAEAEAVSASSPGAEPGGR
jgi:hypothetical protein